MDPKTKQETKAMVKGMWASIQDRADVASAKMRRDDGAEIDVAVVKSTLTDEVPPKEKHVRTLKIATTGSCPRQQVNYTIAGLVNRLEAGKDNWLITLKTLIVFHRLMREVDPSFQDELLKFGERTSTRRMLRLDGFADHTTKDTWDFSAWVRLYSVYLDERLDCFRTIKFDPENDKNMDGLLKTCGSSELLERLPMVQRLLSRMVACLPSGSACNNEIVLLSANMVLREVRAVYKIVCEGIMNLADKFFEMGRNDATRALDIYKENVVLNEKLNTFFNGVNNVSGMRGQVQLPTLQALPPDFQTTLEEYVKEAPKENGMPPPAAPAAAPTAASLVNNIKQGGTTSAALGGTASPSVMPPPMAAPPGVSLKIGAPGQPAAAPAPAARAAAPAEVDLLGADLSEMTMTPPTQPAAAAPPPQPAAAVPPAAVAPTGGSGFWGDNAFAAAAAPAAVAAPATPPPAPAPPPSGFSRAEIPLDLFAGPNGVGPTGSYMPAGYNSAAFNAPGGPGYHAGSFNSAPAANYAAGAVNYPYAPSASFPAHAAQPAAANPFGGAGAGSLPATSLGASLPPAPHNSFQAAPSQSMPAQQHAPASARSPPAASNPFNTVAPPAANPFVSASYPTPGAAQPAFAPAPPAAPPAWSQHHDPLAGLGADVFGKSQATSPPKQSLNQMRKV